MRSQCRLNGVYIYFCFFQEKSQESDDFSAYVDWNGRNGENRSDDNFNFVLIRRVLLRAWNYDTEIKRIKEVDKRNDERKYPFINKLSYEMYYETTLVHYGVYNSVGGTERWQAIDRPPRAHRVIENRLSILNL